MRLISVDELKEWVKNWFVVDRHYHPYRKKNNIPIPELYDILERMPTIEERKTGKWIHTDTQAGYDINGDLVWADMMKCETCGFEIDVIQGHIAQYNFCPNCGARMSE